MVRAAIDGKLNNVETIQDAVFGLHIPTTVEGVPTEVLNPREAWADKAAYDKKKQLNLLAYSTTTSRNFRTYLKPSLNLVVH